VRSLSRALYIAVRGRSLLRSTTWVLREAAHYEKVTRRALLPVQAESQYCSFYPRTLHYNSCFAAQKHRGVRCANWSGPSATFS